MKNLTRHRKIILENLKSRFDHPTARMVYDSAKNSTDKLSFATVYNSLEFLVEEGLIKKLDIDSESSRYDAMLSTHGHFICKTCEKVFDIESSHLSDHLNLKDFNFSAEDISITIRGVCKDCSDAKISE
ncbi:MAG: transcriptional repressor [Leptospiraceae bacterium]|nr:transcriptional repressor [Leptospiraceae bacterium]